MLLITTRPPAESSVKGLHKVMPIAVLGAEGRLGESTDSQTVSSDFDDDEIESQIGFSDIRCDVS